MKVLIVVPREKNSENINYSYLFPLGLAYISSALKSAGHNVHCFNLNHYSGAADLLINNHLAANKYDFICTGGLSTSYNQIKSIVDSVHSIKDSPKLILGGGIISSEPELMFNAFNPDYVVIGEGEETIVELLSYLQNDRNIESVAGIGYRDDNGKIVFNKSRKNIVDLDSIPYPDFEGFEFNKYLDHMKPSDQSFYDLFDNPRVYPLICSRSCPFLCTFCFHPLGNKYRQRSVDSVMRELKMMVEKYKINVIAIYDELFSNDRKWLYDFCGEIKKFIKELSWECKWSCQMRIDVVDDDMLKTMKNSGCYMLSYGFESYSSKVIKSMKKHITPEQIDCAIKLTLKNNLSLQANFIFGDILETSSTAEETLNYWRKNSDAGIMLAFINPYPGTHIYQYCVEKGLIKDKLDFIQNHIFDILNLTDNMTDNQFFKLWFDLHKARLKYRTYGVIKSLKKEKEKTFIISVVCPHCKMVVEYKNYHISSDMFFDLTVHCRNCRRRFFIVSHLYRIVLAFMVICYEIIPNGMKIWTYNLFQKKLKSFVKQYVFKSIDK